MSTNYNLEEHPNSKMTAAVKKLLTFMSGEQKSVVFAFIVMIINTLITMLAPYIIGKTIDDYIAHKNWDGLLQNCGILFIIFIIWAATEYFQTQLMGGVGQRMLFRLRENVFQKIQTLPISFFNQNKSGDLISRNNNDTDRVNQFFSQSLMQFTNSILSMIIAMIFLLTLHPKLGGAALIPGVITLVFVAFVGPWVKKKNAISLASSGSLSADIQENVFNFKAIIAFNRREYFVEKLNTSTTDNYKASINAGIANNVFMPFFTLFANIAQLIVLCFGIYLIINGSFTVGLLISFIAYTQSFYQPLKQLAALWANFQTAMAAWDRISVILNLESNLPIIGNEHIYENQTNILTFKNVSFFYNTSKTILKDVNLTLESGKTYALIGPTGGGKTTTASLMARLMDPTAGEIQFMGHDIRAYEFDKLSEQIGFILQEPIIFTGDLQYNLLFGNKLYENYSKDQFQQLIHEFGFDKLMTLFDEGIDTVFTGNDDNISLGQKQIVAFMRAVLRKPKLLILDEATANIDTISEQWLQEIIDKLPESTTKVIIAHRLNTIQNADTIFFINGGNVLTATNFENALALLQQEVGKN